MSSDMRRNVHRRVPQGFCLRSRIGSVAAYEAQSRVDTERGRRDCGANRWTLFGRIEGGVAAVSKRAREQALAAAGLLHPAPGAVIAPVFAEHPEFFAAFDKVQVKYEMLRAHLVGGETATSAAASHGYSRASFYLVAHAFEESGMVGLLDEAPGRRGPVKLSPQVLAFLDARRRERPGASGAELAYELEQALGVRLHRRTVERALQALGGGRR